MPDEDIQVTKRKLKSDLESIQQLQRRTAKSVERLEKEKQILQEQNTFLLKQSDNADNRVGIYKQSITDNIHQGRERELELIAEIKILKAEIKKLKGQ